MNFYATFSIPFIVGVVTMFVVLIVKYGSWIFGLSAADRMRIVKGIPSRQTPLAVWEVVRESLLHRRIFKVNPLLGYMHMSLAFGWFLLIVVGWIETVAYLGFRYVPLHGHVFFKYFATELPHKPVFDFPMDLLLLFVLSGVTLAFGKRIYSQAMGMRRTTRHVLGDRIALSVLWLIFPARLLAESITCALHGGGGFLTGTIGEWMAHHVNPIVLQTLYEPLWWAYSICLGLFFVALPFSRYMHIFTEIPPIFLRRYKLHSTEKEGSFDRFQTDACSRCGICIDPCQLQSELGIDDVQSVYFLRDRRYNHLRQSVANNCPMCGRCEQRCPVGIELNTLRLNSRDTMRNTPDEKRYEYFRGVDRSAGEGRVGYFAGCMTLLTPRILLAMERIFKASGEEVWWADKEGGVCCGRPLKLSGETDSARKMMDYNIALFRKHRITTLVTSCPICSEGIPGGVSSRRNRSAAPFRVYAAIDPGRPPAASPRGADIHLPRPLRTGTREPYLRPAARGDRSGGRAARTGPDAGTRPLLRLFGGQYGDFGRAAASLGAFRGEGAERYGSGDDRNGLSTL